ncbi:ABC transporter permease [Hamadaea sp. NPDC050747]|uniref:ABC transporter permease n=1 Tax=Hamadaea sp. NPDC050747 TaxID=3155789 RepID=UPI0033C1D6CD
MTRIRSLAVVVYPLLGSALLVLAWWAGVRVFRPQTIVLPSPGGVLDAYGQKTAYLWQMAWVSTWEILLGFAIATVGGMVIGLVLFTSRMVDQTFSPLLVAVNAVPKIALAPVMMVWLGLTYQARLAMVVLLCFFPIVLGMTAGLRSTPAELAELARAIRASRWQTFVKIRLPGALPQLFTGLKVAMPLAAVGSTIGELIGGDSGLGYVISAASGQTDMELMFAALILLALVSVALYLLVQAIEWLLLPWVRGVTA